MESLSNLSNFLCVQAKNCTDTTKTILNFLIPQFFSIRLTNVCTEYQVHPSCAVEFEIMSLRSNFHWILSQKYKTNPTLSFCSLKVKLWVNIWCRYYESPETVRGSDLRTVTMDVLAKGPWAKKILMSGPNKWQESDLRYNRIGFVSKRKPLLLN